MPEFYTPRGFAVFAEIPIGGDGYDPIQMLQVQESSLATERRVWVGPQGGHRHHLTEDQARRLRDALSEFLVGGDVPSALEAPQVIDRQQRIDVQYMVSSALGTRVVPIGETWGALEEPVMSRTVARATERWLGRWPDGRILPTADGPEITEVKVPVQYGPWEAMPRD